MENYNGWLSKLMEAYGIPFAGNNRAGLCPFCGGHRFFVDDAKGIFTCHSAKCGVHGGVTEFAFRLYQTVYAPTDERYPKTRYQAVEQMKQDLGTVVLPVYKNRSVENTTAPIEQRNKVYRRMMHICPLKDADKRQLLSRGYTVPQIRSFGYITLPVTYQDRRETAKRLMEDGCDLTGCPGFEIDRRTGEHVVADFGFFYRKKNLCPDGVALAHYLIPSYDIHGNVQFFQIAWDKRLTGKNIPTAKGPRDFAKYTLFSTPHAQGGGRANASPGYIGRYKKENGVIVPDLHGQISIPVVEGTLKSALFYELSGRKQACISQVGVNNYRSLEKFLVELLKICPEILQIEDCYDMDKFEKKEVAAGSAKLEEICSKLDVAYRCRTWDSRYKGIDDFYYAKRGG